MEEEIKIFIKLDLKILNFPSKVQEPGELYGSEKVKDKLQNIQKNI